MNKSCDIQNYRLNLMICLLLIFAIIIAYGQMRNFDFVGFDDQVYVTENSHVQAGITLKGVVWAFTTNQDANWFPVTWLSHMLDYELYGLNPMGHHWTNLQLHIANTLLLYFVLQLMTGALWQSAFVAALFALHPLHVESVAWVAERKDVLSTFFGMLFLLAYWRYVNQPRLINYLLVIILFSLGLMSKPMLVTFPFVLLLLDFWPLKRFQSKNNHLLQSDGVTSFSFQKAFRLIFEKIPLFILAAISSVLTFFVQQSKGAVIPIEALSLKTRIANTLISYINYVLKAIWPVHLAVFYPHPGDALPAWQIVGAVLLIAAAVFFAIRSSKQNAYIAVGLFWYLGTLVPVIGLVQVGTQAMADRYTYIPLIGLFIIVAWGVSDLFKKCSYRKIFLGVSAVIIISVLTACTYFQVSHWKNGVTLFENAINVTENNFKAQINLGTALGRVDLDRAIFHYKEALKISPDNFMALNKLGVAFYSKENYDEAVLYFTKALRIDPKNTGLSNNLANVLFILGKFDEAVSHYNEVLKTNPEHADAQRNLAYVLSTQGKLDEAVLHYTEALRINPEYGKAHYNLGNILINQGKTKEAMAHFAEAIRISPEYAEVYNKIGLVLFHQGKFKKAEVFFLKAIQIRPNYKEARKNIEALRQTHE